jgi:DNA-binding response OmpR family regulator
MMVNKERGWSVERTTVLVVEDDPALQHAITRNLSVRGYATTSATTVAEALEQLRRACPDLVLLDIDLPDGSGWEVLRALRATCRPAPPAIVLSALRPNTRLVTELECAAVLEKPFPMESLLRLAAEASGRAVPVPGEAAMDA